VAGPVYLALDSAQAWEQWFGAAPPPVDPPVDWERHVVLGAFLRPGTAGNQLVVRDVVQRGNDVVVKLSTSGPSQGSVQPGFDVPGQGSAPSQGGAGPRVMVYVSRNDLEQGTRAALNYMFVDAQGTLLAQGPAGAEALAPTRAAASAMEAPEAARALGMGGGVTETLAAKAAEDSGETEAQALAAPAAGQLAETQSFTEPSTSTAAGAEEQALEQPQEAVAQATEPAGAPAATVVPPAEDEAGGLSPIIVLLIAAGVLVLVGLALFLLRRPR
jgi:hypothetical protein